MSGSHNQLQNLGHEACLDLGVTSLQNGQSAVALVYLDHAANLRPTSFGLTQLAKAHRDLGQPQAARERLEQARDLPGGRDTYVLVSLAAVLCDLCEHGEALDVAQKAYAVDPDSPAVQQVLSRAMKNLIGHLEKSPHIDNLHLASPHRDAETLALAAREATPDSVPNLMDRRRQRAELAWRPAGQMATGAAPIEQPPGVVVRSIAAVGVADRAEDERTTTGSPSIPEETPSLFARGWRRLRSLVTRGNDG